MEYKFGKARKLLVSSIVVKLVGADKESSYMAVNAWKTSALAGKAHSNLAVQDAEQAAKLYEMQNKLAAFEQQAGSQASALTDKLAAAAKEAESSRDRVLAKIGKRFAQGSSRLMMQNFVFQWHKQVKTWQKQVQQASMDELDQVHQTIISREARVELYRKQSVKRALTLTAGAGRREMHKAIVTWVNTMCFSMSVRQARKVEAQMARGSKSAGVRQLKGLMDRRDKLARIAMLLCWFEKVAATKMAERLKGTSAKAKATATKMLGAARKRLAQQSSRARINNWRWRVLQAADRARIKEKATSREGAPSAAALALTAAAAEEKARLENELSETKLEMEAVEATLEQLKQKALAEEQAAAEAVQALEAEQAKSKQFELDLQELQSKQSSMEQAWTELEGTDATVQAEKTAREQLQVELQEALNKLAAMEEAAGHMVSEDEVSCRLDVTKQAQKQAQKQQAQEHAKIEGAFAAEKEQLAATNEQLKAMLLQRNEEIGELQVKLMIATTGS